MQLAQSGCDFSKRTAGGTRAYLQPWTLRLERKLHSPAPALDFGLGLGLSAALLCSSALSLRLGPSVVLTMGNVLSHLASQLPSLAANIGCMCT